MASEAAARAWFIVPTHTTRHLRRALMGVCAQRGAEWRVVVCCDNDRENVRELVRACSGEFGARIGFVSRAFMGIGRLAQNRNNGVRAALRLGAGERDQLIFLDGDCPPMGNFAAEHLRLARRARLVIGRRYDLSPAQTEGFDEGALRSGAWPVRPTAEQRAELRKRQALWTVQAWLKPLGLTKSHKPKPLGANHSAPVWAVKKVNGYDEEYVGYGQEDDDFGRRLYAAGVKPAIGITRLHCFHLYHEARQGTGFHENPGAARFESGATPVFAAHGIANPLPQAEVTVWEFENGEERSRAGLSG
jgi:hypothetical protein